MNHTDEILRLIDAALAPPTVAPLPVAGWHWDANDMVTVDVDDALGRRGSRLDRRLNVR